jgi:flagellar biosynthetic protein FlhB
MMSLIRNFSGVSNLKDADVIITNPTHVAVALKYRSKSMAFPIVTAKGKGFFALWIIKKAKAYGVPVRQFPPLARKIYAESEVNSVIPLSEQESVAEIYKEIIKMSGHRVFS